MRDRIVLATRRTWPEPSSSDRALADAERDPSLQCARARALEPRKELSHRARRPRRSGPASAIVEADAARGADALARMALAEARAGSGRALRRGARRPAARGL